MFKKIWTYACKFKPFLDPFLQDTWRRLKQHLRKPRQRYSWGSSGCCEVSFSNCTSPITLCRLHFNDCISPIASFKLHFYSILKIALCRLYFADCILHFAISERILHHAFGRLCFSNCLCRLKFQIVSCRLHFTDSILHLVDCILLITFCK